MRPIAWLPLCLALIVTPLTVGSTSVSAQSPEAPSAPAVPAVGPTASDTASPPAGTVENLPDAATPSSGGVEIAGQHQGDDASSKQVSTSAQGAGQEEAAYRSVCPQRTGIQATVIIPTSATLSVHGWELMDGDQIAVFSEEDVCAGYLTWKNENAALTLWGDNYLTPQPDGFLDGDSMHVRVRRAVDGKEYSQKNSNITIRMRSDADHLTPDPVFTPGGIYVVDTLLVEGIQSADKQ